ncbi:hypothetical protein [Streptomyces sp. NPDC003032]
MIFRGGQEYAALLRPSVPHLLAPLVGEMDEHRRFCKLIRLDAIRTRTTPPAPPRARRWIQMC